MAVSRSWKVNASSSCRWRRAMPPPSSPSRARRGRRRRRRDRRDDDDGHRDLGGGWQRMGVLYTLDGAMHNNRWFEGNMPTPFPDALAEFRVSTSAGSADRPVVGRHREPGDALGDERVSRHRVLVRPERRVQRPAGDGARARSPEAEPAGRHSAARSLRNRLFFFGLPEHDRTGRPRRRRCRSCRPPRCWPATGRRSTAATGPTGVMRTWPREDQSGPLQPGGAGDRGKAAAGRERTRRAAMGRAQRTARQAGGHTRSTTSTTPTCRCSGATWARSTGPCSPTTSRTSSPRDQLAGREQLGAPAQHRARLGAPTAVNSLRVAHSRIITDRHGAEFFDPQRRRHQRLHDGAEGVPVQRRRPLRVRQRDGLHQRVAEPVSDRQSRRRDQATTRSAWASTGHATTSCRTRTRSASAT